MLLKRIDEAAGKLRSGAFLAEFGSMPGQVDRMGLVGKSASGCSMGLVGAGAIGRAVAVRALALGMRVYAYDPFISPEATSLGIEFLPDLSSLLASVDVVSLHAPGGTSNRSLIGASELAQMRPGSIIVNAARGELVDVDALAAALHSGQLAGAAVDVFDPEPPDVEGALFKAPNLIATPHMAAMTQDALVRMAVDVARAVTHALGNASGKQDLGNG
jgi:phosphoglycerate dehydrogenase-like enzyme